MKLNWGTSIVIAFVLFIGFIMFMVVQMMSKKELEYDMVVESYYQKELTFQDDLDSAQNAANLETQVEVVTDANGVEINFPPDFDYKGIKAELFMYRPSDKTLDFTVNLVLEGHTYVLPSSLLKSGNWEVNLKFQYEEKNYFVQKKIKI